VGVRWRSVQGDAGADAALLTDSLSTGHQRGVALSVDLAYMDYRDIGVALVSCAGDGPEGSLSARAFDVPLRGRPSVAALSSWLREMVEEHDVRCLCIDGPLGWRSPDTDSPHCRLSERAVRAPGKTGLPPDGVKPRTYLGFTTFSIALFEAFTGSTEWALPGDPAAALDARVVTESFPTAGWRALGLSPLMAKGRASVADVQDAGVRLQARTGIALEQVCTHDQLQAVVGGIAGAWWAAGRTERVQLAGAPPFRLDGSWREGYIMIPATTT
jgi:hypothetical protein